MISNTTVVTITITIILLPAPIHTQTKGLTTGAHPGGLQHGIEVPTLDVAYSTLRKIPLGGTENLGPHQEDPHPEREVAGKNPARTQENQQLLGQASGIEHQRCGFSGGTGPSVGCSSLSRPSLWPSYSRRRRDPKKLN
jgi:hypothetical protein